MCLLPTVLLESILCFLFVNSIAVLTFTSVWKTSKASPHLLPKNGNYSGSFWPFFLMQWIFKIPFFLVSWKTPITNFKSFQLLYRRGENFTLFICKHSTYLFTWELFFADYVALERAADLILSYLHTHEYNTYLFEIFSLCVWCVNSCLQTLSMPSTTGLSIKPLSSVLCIIG